MEQLFDTDEPPGAGEAAPAVADAPLATRLRPRTVEEFVGQDRLLAPGAALRRALEEGHAHSMILHGPPGSGKTTLARLVAASTNAVFEEESAVQAGRPRYGR
jgi:putative ATPase